jgi:SAM-dependent methyltransferase
MNECSKANRRRKLDPRFASRWLVGDLVDVGCGRDPVPFGEWPKLTSVRPYDVILGDGDAQSLVEIKDSSLDVVHSAHCLEHLNNPPLALTNWLRVLKPGGFIVCTIPDEFYYECGLWPSRFNGDHKRSFSTRYTPIIPSSVPLMHALWKLPCEVELISLLTDGWDPLLLGQDQTLGSAECAIEFVVRKPNARKPW